MAGYDMMPWKLVFCDVDWDTCNGQVGMRISLVNLPPPPEPGRIPEGADHVHVRPKFSADQRGAREDHLWRTLVLNTTRCEHGRTQGDRCLQCPDGVAPSEAGQVVGYHRDGQPMVIPPRERQNALEAWKPENVGPSD
jgi:hypothetical protein